MNDANVTTLATHVNCLVIRSALGPKDTDEIMSDIRRSLKCNGTEWFVNRQKAIFTASLHLLNNDKDTAISIYRENSIAYTKSAYPKGPFGKVVKMFVTASKPKVKKRMSAVLRCYTAHVLPELSSKQNLKVTTTISSPSTANPQKLLAWGNVAIFGKVISDLLRTDKRNLSEGLEAIKQLQLESFHRRNFSLDKLAPYTSTYREIKGLPTEFLAQPYAKAVASLMTTHYVPKSIEHFLPAQETRKIVGNHSDDKAVGKIHVIQEGGAKARAIAIPNAWTQMAFYPLHIFLQGITDLLLPKESCTYDQESGINYVIEHLKNGKPTFAVDLSAATDRFPLELQTATLEALGCKDYAEALKDLSRSNWVFPQGSKTLQYNVGQPMGLYGSFSLFQLTHGLFVHALTSWLPTGHNVSKFSDGTLFKLLGDDIVFSDGKLSDIYKHTMTELGVGISKDKSISGFVSEFAGFVVLPCKHAPNGYVAYRPYKHTKHSGVPVNTVQLIESLGANVVNMTHIYGKNRWKTILNQYAATRSLRNQDLSPIVSANSEKSPITGTLRIQDAAALQEMLYRLTPGNTSLPPSDLVTRVNKLPIIYDGPPRDFRSGLARTLPLPERHEVEVNPHRNAVQATKNDPFLKQKEGKFVYEVGESMQSIAWRRMRHVFMNAPTSAKYLSIVDILTKDPLVQVWVDGYRNKNRPKVLSHRLPDFETRADIVSKVLAHMSKDDTELKSRIVVAVNPSISTDEPPTLTRENPGYTSDLPAFLDK